MIRGGGVGIRDQIVFNDQMDILKLIKLSRQQSGMKIVHMSLNFLTQLNRIN